MIKKLAKLLLRGQNGIMSAAYTIAEDRAALLVAGEEAAEFLQNLVTQDVMKADACQMAALLTPQGKLAYEFLIYKRGRDFLLDCDRAVVAALQKKLQMYKLRAAVEITALQETLIIIWDKDETLAPQKDFLPDPRDERLGLRGWFTAPPALKYPAAPIKEWHTYRIACGIAQGAAEMPSGDVFPLEFGLEQMHGIDFNKGCFIGQEVCSRVHRKGQLRKQLYVVKFSGEAATPIKTGDRQVGEIVAVQGENALALIRNDALNAPLIAGDIPLTLIDNS